MTEKLRPLIEAAKGGDRQALNSLARCVDRFVRIFHGSISKHLRQTAGSTIDFVLEGLAEALAHLPEFEYRSDEQFYAWISCHIRSRILSAAREAGRRKRAGRPLAFGSQAEGLAAPDASPSSLLSIEEVRAAIGQALIDLQIEHPQEMEVVTLKVFEGESWPAIRDQLQLTSDKRARTLFARGLDLLRPRVEARLGEDALLEFLKL